MPIQPTHTFRANNISIAVWKNENDRIAATIERTYKNPEGFYVVTTRFSAGDLIILAELAKLAALQMLQEEMKSRVREEVANAP